MLWCKKTYREINRDIDRLLRKGRRQRMAIRLSECGTLVRVTSRSWWQRFIHWVRP